MILVSACLLGENCKYNGGNNLCQRVLDFLDGDEEAILPVCPERAGGLPCPRPPAEIREGKVYDNEGRDVTEAFRLGAEKELARGLLAAAGRGEEIRLAVLKARSPSCGKAAVYDGTFTGTLTEGEGVFASLLSERGIQVITEEEC